MYVSASFTILIIRSKNPNFKNNYKSSVSYEIIYLQVIVRILTISTTLLVHVVENYFTIIVLIYGFKFESVVKDINQKLF